MPVNMGTASGSLNLSAKGFVDGINTAITALEKLKTKANDAKEDVKEFGDEAANTKGKTSSLGDKVKESGEKVKGYDDKVKTAKQNTKGFGEETDKTKEKVKTLGESLKGVGDKLTGYGDKISKAGTGLTKYITAPAALIGGFSVKKFADFESAMSTVQATSGSTAEDMVRLGDKAKQMGESTKFSATESAEALNYMAMAGWKTEEMLGGIEGIMDLAAASGEDLATTSDIVTDALTGFGLTAQDSARFADVLAAASSNANTNVSMMGESFKYVAPVAGALGYSAEDVAINLGLMANSGIKGGQAGTALRAALSRLVKPTDDVKEMMKKLNISLTDSNGKVKSLRELNGDLRTSFSKLSDAEQAQAATILFGQEAMSGMLAIIRSGETDYTKLANAIDNSQGVAKKMSEIRMDNFSGQLTLLKSKAEGVGIQFGQQIIPYLIDFVKKIGGVLEWFSKLDDGAKRLIVRSVGLLAALGPILKIFGNITKAAGGVTKAFGAIASHPIVGAVALIATGIVAITTAMVDNIEVVEKDYNAYQEFSDRVRKTSDEFVKLKDARKKAVEDTQSEFAHYQSLKTELDKIVDANGKVKTGYEDRAKFITNELSQALGIEIENNGKVIKNYQTLSGEIDKLIEKQRSEAMLAAYKDSYTAAIKNQSQAQKDLYTATTNRAKQLENVRKTEEKIAALEKDIADPSKTKERAELNLIGQLAQAQEELKQYQNQLSNANTDWQRAQNTYSDYITTIHNYEELSTALVVGNEKKVKEATTNMVNDLITANTGTEFQLITQRNEYKEHYESLKHLASSGSQQVSQAVLNEAKDMLDKSQAELDKYSAMMANGGVNLTTKFANGVNAGANSSKFRENIQLAFSSLTPLLGNSVSQLASKTLTTFSSKLSGVGKIGTDFVDGFGNAITLGIPKVQTTVANLSGKALDSLRINLDSHSPSKETAKYGKWFVEGFVNGIIDNTDVIKDAVAGMTDVALATLSTSPDNFSLDTKSFDTVRPGSTSIDATSSQTNNTFNFYSPEPIDAVEAANQVKKIQKQLAEGFV